MPQLTAQQLMELVSIVQGSQKKTNNASQESAKKITEQPLSSIQKATEQTVLKFIKQKSAEALEQGVPPQEVLDMGMQMGAPQQVQQQEQTNLNQSFAGQPIQQPIQQPTQGAQQKQSLMGVLKNILGGAAEAGLLSQVPNYYDAMGEKQKLINGDESTKKITPQSQMDTLLETQKLLEQQGINNADVNVTATGAPTIAVKSDLGIASLPAEQQVGALELSRRIGGVRGMQKVLPSVIQGLKEGKNLDMIDDELRYMQQSPEFSGTLRNAAQQIMIGEGKDTANRTFDYLDDLAATGDKEGIKSYLKRMSVIKAPVDQRNMVMGKERTIELLNDIQNDLNILEKNGISTGFFSGKYENLLQRVGQVKNPEMRKVATKIAVSLINYRRAITGVQFGMIENKEYKNMFPNIDKIGKLNTSIISGLNETFAGDLDNFYSLSMGKDNYQEIFNAQKVEQSNSDDLSSMSDEELKAIINGGK